MVAHTNPARRQLRHTPAYSTAAARRRRDTCGPRSEGVRFGRVISRRKLIGGAVAGAECWPLRARAAADPLAREVLYNGIRLGSPWPTFWVSPSPAGESRGFVNAGGSSVA